ncbi:hypothetical protein DERF_002112 [Dermatophagoides farinae]|uniref:Uncharacterized protein n=1 Tax=Dermatophagoides farinae TaxID=6954 RepID=A0A922LAA9_DERFA|nr:hypothetical protein DERF_002112 [Dermatophagoides farinae]
MLIKIFLCSFIGLIVLVTEIYGQLNGYSAIKIKQHQGRSLDFLSDVERKKNSFFNYLNQTVSGAANFNLNQPYPPFDSFNKFKIQTLQYFERMAQMKQQLIGQLISALNSTIPDPCNKTYTTTTPFSTTMPYGERSTSTQRMPFSTRTNSDTSSTSTSTSTTSTTTEFTLPPITYVMPNSTN